MAQSTGRRAPDQAKEPGVGTLQAMSLGTFDYPRPANEPVRSYAPGSPERASLKAALKSMKSSPIEVPMTIGGKAVTTGNLYGIRPPHEHGFLLGHYHQGTFEQVQLAIDAALAARHAWSELAWETRANVFLKAADLLAGKYRNQINGATMLGQSKNAFQAEIDSACELADFLRFNVHFVSEIMKLQPGQAPGMHNRMEFRGLEGFILAITPFNFTAIAGNLPTSCAMCGNTVVWKPSNTQIYSAQVFMNILREAGLPDGVINLVFAPGPAVGETCLSNPHFAGVHFTGSTGTFNTIWKGIGDNVSSYKTYPRVVGETGGKDFVIAHPSADAQAVITGLLRGAFEYQGQKCSAASRCYVPSNIAKQVREGLVEGVKSFKMGTVEDFSNFVNAVIDEKSFDGIMDYLGAAKSDAGVTTLVGGSGDKSAGYFVEPTVLEVADPMYRTMCEEIFGPVLTMYVYDESKFEDTLDLVDQTSPYALTGAVFSQDRTSIEHATRRLRHAAGNFYVNDKPTGAVVGQQPFGGARGSGTNDKSGSMLNLFRWLSPRTIKETLVSPTDYRYPFLAEP